MNVNASIFFAILLLAVTGCDRAKTKEAQTQPQKPASFHDTMFMSVTPTADGGAYAIGFDSGLWYLRGLQAVKVQFPSLPPDAADTFFVTLQITPLLDGGAYAHSMMDKSFWHLRADTAERVSEVPSLSSMPPVALPLSAFPLYIAERQKRLEAEQERDERPNPDDRPEPEPDN
ncbi:MAG TPA: hypothetical protein VK581_08585 [Chthoniobacterales bacterium]|nr:hypothetical protein [Chthoniobacterales bacterium]